MVFSKKLAGVTLAKQKQPMLRLFLSARALEHLDEQGSKRAAAKLDAKESLVAIAKKIAIAHSRK